MSLDIADIIKTDHNNVRDLFQKFKAATDADKVAIGNTILREMSVHGDAEDMSLYNTFDAEGLGKMADMDRKEHGDIKQLIKQADKAKAGSADYVDLVKRAVEEFLEHSQKEEQDQLTKIVDKLSSEENEKVARKFLKARKNAVTSQMSSKEDFVAVKKPLPEV